MFSAAALAHSRLAWSLAYDGRKALAQGRQGESMNRVLFLALVASAALAGTMSARLGLVDPPVNLQAVTPGVQQVGNTNISGKAIAGSISASNSSPTAQVIVGNATSTTGANYAGLFRTDSNAGTGIRGVATATTGAANGGTFQTASPNGGGVRGNATSPTGVNYGVYGKAVSPSGFGVYGVATASAGSSAGGFFQSNSEEGNGVLGIASNSIGSTAGVNGQSASVEGYGVFGSATNAGGTTFGVFGQSVSPSGYGVFGQATAASGTTYGVFGRATSPNGYGVYSEGKMHATGVISGNGSGLTNVNAAQLGGFSSSAFLQAVPVPLSLTGSQFNQVLRVENTNIGASSSNGIVGVSNASAAFGIFGVANGDFGRAVVGFASGGGANFGGYFSTASSSTDATGVFGTAFAPNGTTYGMWGQSESTSGFGAIGIATAATGVTYGLYGRTTSTAGVAVFAQGNMAASGTKPFRIDHPFSPENKYLLHYAAESPMPQNFYVGNVVTDSKGYAWVDLPDYFAEINKNFKYQLTVVGKSFAQAIVWEEIVNNRFQIRTNEPNIKVSWRVDADRNDLYVRNRPPKDVMAKEGPEKGTYQHPEFYGLGPERGMNYHPAREKQPKDPPAAQANKR